MRGVSEQPVGPPDPSSDRPAESPRRYDRSFGGLLAAMLVTVVVVAGYVGVRALTRDQPEVEPEPVDYLTAVRDLQRAGDTVLYPIALPAGWIATSIDFEPGRPPSWRIGMLTDRGSYLGIVQGREDTKDLVSTYVDESPTRGEPTTADNEVGVASWDTWSDAGGDHAFTAVLDSGPLAGQTILVYGSAPEQDQRALIGLLTLDPVAAASGGG